MIFAALNEAAERGELVLDYGGLLRWHKRRDGVVVIREILVLPHLRGSGIGQRMVEALIARSGADMFLAKCPQHYRSNSFWARCGFTLTCCEKGINVWERRS